MDTSERKLNSNQLKAIAIAAMTIDHIAWAMFPNYSRDSLPIVMHILGRVTCPIMCFFIVEGYHHTRNLKNYTIRLFGFSIVSHFAYLYASASYRDWKSFLPFYYGDFFNQTSVMWSLAWGLLILRIVNSEKIKHSGIKAALVILSSIVCLPADWSCIGCLCIFAFGRNRGKFKSQMTWLIFYVFLYAFVYFFAIDNVYGLIQLGAVLSIPLLQMYNGKRGENQRVNRILKWTFYIYYPFHLLVIGFLKDFCKKRGCTAVWISLFPK